MPVTSDGIIKELTTNQQMALLINLISGTKNKNVIAYIRNYNYIYIWSHLAEFEFLIICISKFTSDLV